MKKSGLLLLAALLSGCAASTAPLPEQTATRSAVDYADALVTATTAQNLDRFITTTKSGETEGYRWYSGWWCPRHESVTGQSQVFILFRSLCSKRNGEYDGEFCRSKEQPDDVIFAAKVYQSNECSAGQTVSLNIVEPTDSLRHPAYMEALEKRGFETVAEQAARREQLERQRKIREVTSAAEGTRICQTGPIDYAAEGNAPATVSDDGTLIAQLDGVSDSRDRIRFRILSFELPESTTRTEQNSAVYRMREFNIEPGAVYWDKAENWEVCE